MDQINIKTKEFAELIGILLGDGSISIYNSNKNKKYYRLKISFNSKDKAHIEYVKKLIFSMFKINPIVKFRKEENTAELLLFKREIIRFLLEDVRLILSPKWGRAKIPSVYLNNKLEFYVLRGYFDTDGSVVITDNNGTKYPRLEMKICPSPMQEQFIDILKRNRFKFGVYAIGKGKVRIQLNGKHQLKRWYKTVGFSNLRYLKKAEQFL